MSKLKWPCSRCEQEFNSNEELKDHPCPGSAMAAKGKKLNLPPELEEAIKLKKSLGLIPPPVDKNKEPKPITLLYRFEGDCPDCLSSVETIRLDVPGKKSKSNVVAWCGVCKKQLHVQEVNKL